MTTTLITGGAGFIGSNLAKYMVRRGDRVRIIDDLSTGDRRNIEGLDVDFIEDSILNYEMLCDVMRGIDSVVHLAAIPSVPRSIAHPLASHHANATGTLHVLEAARETDTHHVVVASSSSVYGANPELPKTEQTWLRPMSPYAVAKLATEAYPLAYQHSYGLSTLAFRFFNVFGPGQAANHAYAAVVPKFIDAALSDEPLIIHGDGQQSRDFTYIDTVCAVLADANARRVSEPEPVNLAYGTNTTINQLVTIIEKELRRPLDRNHVESRRGDVKASQADSAKVRRLFPDVQPVPLEQGIRETVAWFTGHLMGAGDPA